MFSKIFLRRITFGICILIGIVFISGGCLRPARVSPAGRPKSMVAEDVGVMGFTIQAGAFAVMDNAVRLADRLRGKGVEAIYFIDKDALYKVRFGDFSDRDSAVGYAMEIKAQGLIDDFFIVSPQSYPVRSPAPNRHGIRKRLVSDAHRFIGSPYRWGGTQPSGFDCSGLTLTVYRLNGIVIPRTSAEQYDHGRAVSRRRLKPGDLVFFSTGKNKRVSHVGIYIGNRRFIHAPGKGRQVQEASLSDTYYKNTFAGARTYLR
ncbi:MAG: NlpC/P60 family protein [bacterium]